MEFKGTKDKWGVCSANKTEVNSYNGTAIAECGMSQMATMEERQANARLIAAAPDMLKALQMAVQAFDELQVADGATCRIKAKAAINKALNG